VRTAVTLDRDDPAREAAVAAVREATNSWVAKYRRDNQFSGKPSYG
jgi:photosystem II Psb27 protein